MKYIHVDAHIITTYSAFSCALCAAVFGVVARAANVNTYEVLISRDSEHAAADGELEFEQVAMAEGVQCWHDRPNYFYRDVPESLIPGTLLRGNHKVDLQSFPNHLVTNY